MKSEIVESRNSGSVKSAFGQRRGKTEGPHERARGRERKGPRERVSDREKVREKRGLRETGKDGRGECR